jgi:hypothetical protein
MRQRSTKPRGVCHNDQSAPQLGSTVGSDQQPSCAPSSAMPPLRKQQTSSARAVAPRLSPSLPSVKFEDAEWISIFQLVHRLLSHLYRDKAYIEISHYLRQVEMNLTLAGYRGAHEEIATRFGTLFPRLGFQAAKGRDVRKFVDVRDVFGREEPFALLKLECEDG